jgi:inner membrane protein
MSTQETFKKTGDFICNSATIKIISIGIVVLVLLIPTAMVGSLMRERQSRRDSVVAEISQKWGGSQTITGPYLSVPFKVFYKDDKGNAKVNIRHLCILPENLDISGSLTPHVRYRSLYEAVLYNAVLSMTGSFALPALTDTDIDPANILWEKAAFCLGITDMRGIQDNIAVTFGNKTCQAGPGLKTTDIASSGVQCPVVISGPGATMPFSLHLNLNGSDQLHFIPIGETTRVKLTSPWPSPSFNGSFLPTERTISDKGFAAEWKVLHLNRNYPQFWQANQYGVGDSAFGLRLLVTADVYQKAIRVSKYAMMFIVFTFSAFFFSEIISKRRVHPIQYMLVGLSIMLFYVLLLAIAEYIKFDYAYILSALAITATITGYSYGILKNSRFTVTVCGLLVLLYAYLYIVLQLEDYALLMGSIGLFLILAAVMYVTRNIDWYCPNKGND